LIDVQKGDPVDMAISWGRAANTTIPVICAANDKRAGGDWETGVQGYEERLCRRSTLACCLGTPAPNAGTTNNFPIPSSGGIYSSHVVVFRGPHYEKLEFDDWANLPIISVPPTRWPKLDPTGSKYSFSDERAMVKDKIRGALRIAAYYGHDQVVIAGDWGLGNGHRNPPRELAELWREVLLYDPELRGRIREAAFVFEDQMQSTAQLIVNEMSKKDHKRDHAAKGKGKGSSSSSSSSSSSATVAFGGYAADCEIYAQVFDNEEIKRVLQQPDARYGLENLLTK
jgi:uncharacterized protein (TIGR02452 family)